eukprot:TRINITY_DN95774_c0_g1_i1.p1 TRINITY_DN95774_c0_g1~~TRINITY_DN95774_c0_g1_i1.p1  ORF type:complete len:116 (+),score=10.39 TRINITY_DN95774_c0_g1_i1:220-567(+)
MDAFWMSRGLDPRGETRRRRGGCVVQSRGAAWAPEVDSVDALVGEPYDGSVEERECDLQLWQHWARVDEYRPALRDGGFIWPCRFRVLVAAVHCPKLWRRRQPLSGRRIARRRNL